MKMTLLTPPHPAFEIPCQVLGPAKLPSAGMYQFEADDIEIGWHQHNCGMLVLPELGLMGIASEEESLLVTHDSILYVPPHLAHYEFSTGHPIAGWYISLPPSCCEDLPKQMTSIRPTASLEKLCREVASWGAPPSLTPPQQKILRDLLRKVMKAQSSAHPRIPVPRHPSLWKVANAIFRTPHDMRGLDHWSKQARLPRRTFTRHFQRETGISFLLWKQRVKIFAAVQMMAKGARIGETASQLGYKNTSNFISVFRNEVAHTPLAYLKRISPLRIRKRI